MATVAVVSLPAMFSLAALTVDVGLLSLRHGEAQNVSDAAALAASMRIDGTSWGLYHARSTAVRTGQRNTVGGTTVAIDRWNDITFGRVIDGEFVAESDPVLITAVKVDITNMPVPALFSKAFRGNQPFRVSGNAIATGNDPVDPMTIPYVLPLSLPYCLIETATDATIHTWIANLDGSGGAKKMSWTSADWFPWSSVLDDSVGPLVTDCLYPTTDSASSWACSPVSVSDWSMSAAHSSSGYQPVVAELVDAGIRVTSDGWDTSLWGTQPALKANSKFIGKQGKVISGPILLVDNDFCSNGRNPTWNRVAGFVWVSIYDAVAIPGTSTTSASSNLWAKIDMKTVHLIGVGETIGPPVEGGVLALGKTKLVH